MLVNKKLMQFRWFERSENDALLKVFVIVMACFALLHFLFVLAGHGDDDTRQCYNNSVVYDAGLSWIIWKC